MSTLFFLIRHGSHDHLGRVLTGRMPGVSLNGKGVQEATRLAERLSRVGVTALYSSPMDRAVETARPLAETLRLPLRVDEAIQEIDFGEWMGRRFEELAPLPEWHRWNAYRSGSRAPGGESMLEVQARMVREMERLCGEHPGGRVALVGHSDPLKAAVAYFLGMPLDFLQRIEIEPGSVTTLELGEYAPRLVGLNVKAEDPAG